MRLVLDVDMAGVSAREWIRSALSGLHASTDAACELGDALRAASRGMAQGRVDNALVTVAFANHGGNVAATARALGIARSTVRARLARATAAADALDAEARAANDNASGAERRSTAAR